MSMPSLSENVATVTLPGVTFGSDPALTLTHSTTVTPVAKRAAQALKAAGHAVESVTRHAWSTLSGRFTDAEYVTDDGETVNVAVPVFSHGVIVDRPTVKTGGKTVAAPLPKSAHVAASAFGVSADIALAEFGRAPHAEKRDGKPTGRMIARENIAYGAATFVRPNGAEWVFAVKVTPGSDGKTYRVSSVLSSK